MTKSAVLLSKGISVIPSTIKTASSIEELNMKRDFRGPRTLDWDTLKNLKVDDQFNDWLSPEWKRFFDIVEPAYQELVFEFFSTYRFNKNTDDVDSKAMHFRLRGKDYSLSFTGFARAMGLYTHEEMQGEAFQKGITGWPADASPSDFWNSFASEPHHKNVSCTSITKPSLKILHRAISESINQRGSCCNNVTLEDLFYMYCILTKTPCNLAKCLARYLYKSPGKSGKSAVCGGAYVTRLALGLKAVTKAQLLKMEVIAKTCLFDEAQLRKLDIVEKDAPLRFVAPGNEAGGNANTDNARHACVKSLAARMTSMEVVMQWQSKALSFLIKEHGFVFDPPPQTPQPTDSP